MDTPFIGSWPFWALLSAVFAALTAIFAKVGVKGVDSDVATFIRTIVILMTLGLILIVMGKAHSPGPLSAKTWIFLVLSGLGDRCVLALLFSSAQTRPGRSRRTHRQAQCRAGRGLRCDSPRRAS